MEPLGLGVNYINVDIDDFDLLVKDLIYNISNPNIVYAEELKFIVNEDYLKPVKVRENDGKYAKQKVNFETLARCGMPVLDHYLFTKNKVKNGLKLQVDTSVSSFNFSDFNKSIFAFYFILMTRAKYSFQEDEMLPKFLREYIDIKISPRDVISMISRNNVNKFNHTWIKKVKVSNFSKPVIQRLLKGIAGFRNFSALKSQSPKRLKDVEPEVLNAYSLSLDIATRGPFYENHPFFMPVELSNMAISKNLLNIISLIFDKEQLERMVINKFIRDIPRYDDKYEQYKSWNSDLFKLFKTPIYDVNELEELN